MNVIFCFEKYFLDFFKSCENADFLLLVNNSEFLVNCQIRKMNAFC